MNRQIRAVSLLAGLMFLALMVNLTGSAMFRQASLNNDPHNVCLLYTSPSPRDS